MSIVNLFSDLKYNLSDRRYCAKHKHGRSLFNRRLKRYYNRALRRDKSWSL